MASFDPKTPLDASELDYISNQLNICSFFKLGQNLLIYKGIQFEEFLRQVNIDDPRRKLFKWHSNQNPANERTLMVNALDRTLLSSLAETIRMGDQYHATGNAVASNLNMSALLDDLELKSVSKQPGPQELLKLSTSSVTLLVKLARQYMEKADPCSEMLNTLHSNQSQPKERGSQKDQAFNESTQDCLATEKVQMGGCHTVPQGMTNDQHHATGNAVVSNLNMGALLDDLELKSVSKQPGPQELLKLITSSVTLLVKLARQYMEKADPCSEMLNTLHSNQSQPKERGSQKDQAFNESTQDCLATEKVQMGGGHALQPSSAQHNSRPRKQTHTQTLAGHETNTLKAMQMTQQTSYEITEIKLRDVSNKLGTEWRMVGTYLGFKNSEIEVMHEQYPVVKECIFQMLLQWRNTNGVKAAKEKLKKVLRRSLVKIWWISSTRRMIESLQNDKNFDDMTVLLSPLIICATAVDHKGGGTYVLELDIKWLPGRTTWQ